MTHNIGMEAIKEIHQRWQVDDDRCVWHENGFDWWPGDFKQSLRVQEPRKRDDALTVYPLTATTDFLTHVPDKSQSLCTMLDGLGRTAPSYCLRAIPHPDNKDQLIISLISRVYLDEENVNWMWPFFSGIAIMQPVDAQIRAQPMAEMCDGQANRSSPSEGVPSQHYDELLEIIEQVYVPAGQETSKWSGSDEIAQIAERFGRSDMSFGVGGSDGVTLETPCGDDSILIRLFTDQEHPQLGNGLTVTLQLPWSPGLSESQKAAAMLNLNESISFTSFPLLGCWHAHEVGNSIGPAFGSFVPNILYQPVIATNMVLWMLGRARWTKDQLWPDLEDLTMAEIIKKRFGA